MPPAGTPTIQTVIRYPPASAVNSGGRSYGRRLTVRPSCRASLLVFMLLGGVAFWFEYRFFGTMLMIAAAALLVWFAAGAPI